MEFSLQHIVFFVLVICTGMSAGLCFTWMNAVTPGIGRLNDLEFLKAFQEMNRVILNPTFYLIFLGPFFLGIINLYLFKNVPSTIWALLLIAALIYFIGVILITVFGNVPLNEVLDQSKLETLNIDQLQELRKGFEAKWNQFHKLRTITSVVSFILLIVTTTQITK